MTRRELVAKWRTEANRASIRSTEAWEKFAQSEHRDQSHMIAACALAQESMRLRLCAMELEINIDESWGGYFEA